MTVKSTKKAGSSARPSERKTGSASSLSSILQKRPAVQAHLPIRMAFSLPRSCFVEKSSRQRPQTAPRSCTESVESNAESAETCHIKSGNFIPQMATSMLKVASDIYKMPLYRTAHSPENFSDEWAFFFPYFRLPLAVTHPDEMFQVFENRQTAQNTPLKVYLTQFPNQYIIGSETNYRKG